MTVRHVLAALTVGAAILLSGCTTAPDSPPARSPSTTPMASATPTPTRDPEGVVAFGGDCTSVLSATEATEYLGFPMRELASAWSPGADHRLGGVECAWTTSETYAGARLTVFAYPMESAGIVTDGTDVSGCEISSWVECATSRYVGDLWVWATLGLPADAGADVPARLAERADAVVTLVAERAALFPSAYATARTPDWWQIADCSHAIDVLVEAGVLSPGSRVDDRWGARTGPYALTELMGSSLRCTSVDDREDGMLDATYFALWPGGGSSFALAASTEQSEAASVPGASAAVVAPSLDALEGHTPMLVVTDGPNLLAVPIDFEGLSEENVALAGAILAALANS